VTVTSLAMHFALPVAVADHNHPGCRSCLACHFAMLTWGLNGSCHLADGVGSCHHCSFVAYFAFHSEIETFASLVSEGDDLGGAF